MTDIDLMPLTSNGSVLVISGQDKGQAMRKEYRLDTLDRADERVNVMVPDFVDAITPSFVLGMFGPSVRRFGSVATFLSHYNFKAKPHIISQVQRGAAYGLVSGSALDRK